MQLTKTKQIYSTLLKARPFLFSVIKDESEYFYQMLDHYLTKISYKPPSKAKILDLGCAYLTEGKALQKYFGERASVLGVDMDVTALEIANALNNGQSFNFVFADAKRLDRVVREEFDIILNRHPDVVFTAKSTESWLSVYKSVRNLLNEKGILLATAVYEKEVDALTKILMLNDYNLELYEENPYQYKKSDLLTLAGIIYPVRDRYIVIAKRA